MRPPPTSRGGRLSRLVAAAEHGNPAAAPSPTPKEPEGLRVADGSLEALKWTAAVLMVLDHVNRSLLGGAHAFLYDLGRLAMPVFGFVLMYNLARPGASGAGVHGRVMRRLLVFGLLATPPCVGLAGWWPLNVLLMLMLATGVVSLLERRRFAAAVLVLALAGALVEFLWFGVLACLGAWGYCRRPCAGSLALWALALCSLWLVNRNFSALAALPLLWAAARIEVPIARRRWFFYAFYPGHLALIWGWQLACDSG